MRLLWISASFPPAVGGMQTYNDELTARIAERHEVTVITAAGQRPRSTAVAHFECEGLRGAPDDLGWRRSRERVRELAARAAPAMIHLGDAQMAAYRDVLPAGKPAVVSVHGNDLTKPWIELGRADPIAAIRAGLATCQRVVAVSRHTASLVSEGGVGTPVEVVHNACDLDRFRPLDFDRADFLSSFRVPSDVPLILTVGRFAPRKGQMVVLRALAGLDVPLHWLVIGAGKNRRRLKLARLAYRMSRRMTVSGWLDPDDLVRVYSACDLFVLAPIERRKSGRVDSEGFGLVFHEAAACGVPSIASDTSGCREAVIDGRTGLLVPPGRHRPLRRAIAGLLADDERRQALGRAAREHVTAAGGWDSVARRFDGIYEEIIAETRPG